MIKLSLSTDSHPRTNAPKGGRGLCEGSQHGLQLAHGGVHVGGENLVELQEVGVPVSDQSV